MPLPRALHADDRDTVREFLVRRWGTATIMLDGRAVDAATLPGYLAHDEDGAIAGLITLLDDAAQSESEIVTLDAVAAQSGLGTRLLDCAVERAASFGIARLLTRTTNDNLDALRFYQRRGFALLRLMPGAIDREREADPRVPLIGRYGIALRDEITLVRVLGGA